jgi:hypothetical protein
MFLDDPEVVAVALRIFHVVYRSIRIVILNRLLKIDPMQRSPIWPGFAE